MKAFSAGNGEPDKTSEQQENRTRFRHLCNEHFPEKFVINATRCFGDGDGVKRFIQNGTKEHQLIFG